MRIGVLFATLSNLVGDVHARKGCWVETTFRHPAGEFPIGASHALVEMVSPCRVLRCLPDVPRNWCLSVRGSQVPESAALHGPPNDTAVQRRGEAPSAATAG